MDAKILRKIQVLYKKSEQLLKSGRFGDGLWPIDPFLGQFLCGLIQLYKLKNGLEIGAGVGYSTAFLTAGFEKTGGKLVSLEYFLPKVEQLEKHLNFVLGKNYEKTVQVIPSDFRKLIRHSGRAKFDFVFLDHRKNDYLPAIKMLIPYLKKGAFVCADNVLSHEKACSEYLDFVRNDKRFQSVCLPMAEGLEVTRYAVTNRGRG